MQGTTFSSALAMELRRRAAAYWWEGAGAATMHLPAESRESPVGPSSLPPARPANLAEANRDALISRAMACSRA